MNIDCRIILVASTLISMSYVNYAQESYGGLRVGYNLSELKSDNSSRADLETLRAFSVAVVYAYEPGYNSVIGFSLEPGYTLKGTNTNIDTLSYRFNYLSLPILLDYYPFDKLKISLGPEVSYLLKAKNIDKPMPVDTIKVSKDISDVYNKRLELGGTVGVNYSLSYFLDVGIRFSTSFTKISKEDAILNRRKLFNQYLQFSLLFKLAN